MLTELRIQRPRGDRRALPRARAGHDGTDRRDRRGQDDARRGPRPAGRRPVRCHAGPPGCGRGRGRGSLRPRRRGAGAGPGRPGRRTEPGLRGRPPGHGGVPGRGGALGWSTCTVSTPTRACWRRPRSGRRSTTSPPSTSPRSPAPAAGWPSWRPRWRHWAATRGRAPARSTSSASRSTRSTKAQLDGPDEDAELEKEALVLSDASAHREAAGEGRRGPDRRRRRARRRPQRAGRGAGARASSPGPSTGCTGSPWSSTTWPPSCAGRPRPSRTIRSDWHGSATVGPSSVSCAASTATRWRRCWRSTARPRSASASWRASRVGPRRSSGERAEALAAVDTEAERVGEARRVAAPRLARAVGDHLRQLAMPRARLDVEVERRPALRRGDVPARCQPR